jgi:hypothetical protein
MKNDSVKSQDAIRRLALLDLDATTDEELRAEFTADGVDPDTAARAIAAELDAVVAAAMRGRTAAAKVRVAAPPKRPRVRPALASIKEMIDNAFRTDASLAAAFRDGKQQSDADLQSLYDDLVELGKIDPESDG